MSHFDELATFVHVVDCGGISAAARRMRLPKSTVSRRLARLEEALSVRLLQRTTRKLQLTDAGRELFDSSANAVARLEDATRRVQEHQDAFEGRIRITAPVDYGQTRLGPVLAEFSEKYPDVKVELELTSRVTDLIEEGFDFAIRAGKLRDSTLVARKLEDIPVELYASNNYLRRSNILSHPTGLEKHQVLHFTALGGTDSLTFTRNGQTVSVDIIPQVATNDLATLRRLVESGVGMALIPSAIVEQEVLDGKLKRVLEDWTFMHDTIKIHLVYPTARQLPARVRAMRDLMLQRLRRPSR
jgi:DNA-binding transcriptional LysR family regulator